MAQNDGPTPVPRLVSNMEALEDAYDQYVRGLIEKLPELLARLDR